MSEMRFEVARVDFRLLADRLRAAGMDADLGAGLSPMGEAVLTVRGVSDPGVVRAILREHSHAGVVRELD